MAKTSELHLMIIWKNALYKKNKILEDLKQQFTIRNMFNIKWTDENYSDNLSRFYGTSLPAGSGKEEHCGKGTFLLIIFEDKNPQYDYRMTSHGKSYVNTNVFDKKTLYRNWTGGGHKIHATDNTYEFNHDITLLLGVNALDFKNSFKQNNRTRTINQDIVGANGWNSLEELFYVLNNCIKYIVLRDFENDMMELYNIPSYDADILCENEANCKWLLNADLEMIDGKPKYSTILKGNKCLFDIKSIDDGYYCQKMANDILDNRVMNNFYYVPKKEYHYMSCLYHALVHKFNFETEYNKRLEYIFGKKIHNSNNNKEYFIDKCSKWLLKHNYDIVIYKNNLNNFNEENIKMFDPNLYSEDLFMLHSIYAENSRLKVENLNLKNNLNYINENYSRVINSKGWKFLEKIRKIVR